MTVYEFLSSAMSTHLWKASVIVIVMSLSSFLPVTSLPSV